MGLPENPAALMYYTESMGIRKIRNFHFSFSIGNFYSPSPFTRTFVCIILLVINVEGCISNGTEAFELLLAGWF